MMTPKLKKTIATAVSVIILISLLLPVVSPAPIKAVAKASTPPIAAPVINESASPVEQGNPIDKIEPSLLDELAGAGQTDFFIWMAAKADLSPAYQLRTKGERGRFVFETMRKTADYTQKAVREYLDGQGLNYRPFYIANKIFVRGGDQALMVNLASRPDVARITANHQFQLQEPFINPNSPDHILAVEPNISFINADDVWAMDVTGQGIVLAGNDTGLSWNHPALINHYRGWNGVTADHNYNWWDATDTYPTAPNDGHGHGTHTTGTMVGDDGGANQIGIAPGAKTIHCKNLTDFGGGSDLTISECFEWNLAPWDLTGANPRPDLAPDAINNSWGYGGGNFPEFEDEIATLQAAGILVEFSAGNSGPTCASLGSPGDYRQVLTTGSVNHAGGSLPGTLTDFSSRGPSDLYPSPPHYFPDVMAPGENIRSSLPGGTYASWSGTSMAGPHTTGLIGLMWSANPALQGWVTETVQIIADTARPLTGQPGSNCGGNYSTGPNNDWGNGTIDALAAVQQAILYGGSGTLAGAITDSSTGLGLTGALVQATASPTLTRQTTAGVGGLYSMRLFSQTYTVTASIYGYQPQAISSVSIVSGTTTTLNIQLPPAPSYVVSGLVTDANTGWPLYARIDIAGYPGSPIWTDPVSGAYSVTLAAGIPYNFSVATWVTGYNAASRTLDPLGGNRIENFALTIDLTACTAPGYQHQYVYFKNFEANKGGFTASGLTSWAWGTPTSGPNQAHSGEKVWATNLSGNYADNENGYTTSPNINLSHYAGQPLSLTWWQWLQTESNFDYASVEVSNDGGASWTLVYGEVSGPVDMVWTEHSVPLSSSYAVSNFRVRFHFLSDGSVIYPGYYLDDVGISAGCTFQSGGLVVGNVYDANTGDGLNGAKVASVSVPTDTILTVKTPDDPAVNDGFYILFSSMTGSHSFITTLDDYDSNEQTITVVAGDVVVQDFNLPAGYLATTPLSFTITLPLSQTISYSLTLNNTGGLAAGFNLIEINAPPPALEPTGPFAESTQPISPKHLYDRDASALSDYPPPEAVVLTGGEIIATWPTGLPYAWGIGFNTDTQDLWLSNIGQIGGYNLAYRFLTDGTATGDTIDLSPWVSSIAADMTYNPLTDRLWQVNVGGDNCIYELDPAAQVSTGNKICPAFATSQRGLAYDPTTQTFYAGSWNDGLIHHFDTFGTLLDSQEVGLNISGLAFNPATGHLFVMTNSSEGLDIYVLDVHNHYAVVGGFNIAGLDFYEQAALELDCDGHLWLVNQSTQMVIEADSGERGVCDWRNISWLDVAPPSGNVAESGTQVITLTFDTTGLAVGTYQAHLWIGEDTPYNVSSIPVTLIVTEQASSKQTMFLPIIIK